MKKELARINGKDVCDDWIYEEIFSDEYVRTPFHRNKTNDVIGFYHGCLLSAHWIDDGTTFEFNFIDYPCAIVTEEVIKEFVNYLNETNGTDSSDLRSEIKVNGTQIKATYYWEEEVC